MPSTCRPAIGATRGGRLSVFAQDASLIGPATAALCELILEESATIQGRASAPAWASCGWPKSFGRRARRSGLPSAPSRSARGARLGPLDPRNKLDRRDGPTRRGRHGVPAHQHPRPRYYHWRRSLLNHPTLNQLQDRPSRHGQGLVDTPRGCRRPRPCRNGSACCWIGRRLRRDKRLRREHAKLRHQAASKMSTTARRAVSTVRCSRLVGGDWIDAHANLSARARWGRQVLARLCAWPQGLPRQSLRALSAC